MKLKIAICDDEPILCEELREKILKLYSEFIIDIFHAGNELLEVSGTYDIIFLDIEMPGENGMEIAKRLRSLNCKSHIVFVTSHRECMPEAFKVKAFRFLEKPLNLDALKEALADAGQELLDVRKIVVNNFGAEVLVNISDIIYIHADGKNTVVHMESQEIETGSSLKYWMEKLKEYDFFQVHKSYLVSLGHIRKILPAGVVLKGEEEKIPLSRRRYAAVKNVFIQYIGEHAGIM